MIERLQKNDIHTVAEIWLDTNLKAHDFIAAQYWKDHFTAVKEMLLQAEVYVYKENDGIQGFLGLQDDYIAGIFVWSGAQSRGIGKRLLDFVKSRRAKLSLSVYQKNVRAIQFYQREHFTIQGEDTDQNTGEQEYYMAWNP